LPLKIDVHEGPCLAVMLNERQEYFGQTVNVASRVQNLADAHAIVAQGQVVENGEVSNLLKTKWHHGDATEPCASRYRQRSDCL
jgi:class 3 adenylate cyclase